MNPDCWEGAHVVRMSIKRVGKARRGIGGHAGCAVLYRAMRACDGRLEWRYVGATSALRWNLGAILADAVLLAAEHHAIILPGFGGLHGQPVGDLDELPSEPVPDGLL